MERIRIVLLVLAALAITTPTLATPADDAALAAADASIAANRRGPAQLKIHGVAHGSQVKVSLNQLDFHWGAGAEGGPLNLSPSAADARYQAKVRENFNSISTNGPGMWSVNDEFGYEHLDWMYAWAEANDFNSHLHTTMFEYGDPEWINDLKNRARTSASAKSQLRAAISSRTQSFVPRRDFDEIEVYNESYMSGDDGNATYWRLFGASGVADFYHEARVAATAAGHTPTIWANDCSEIVYFADKAAGYVEHIRSIQNAAAAKGYGQAIDAIGIQFYQDPVDNIPSRFAQNVATLSQLGLPMAITEFGAYSDTSPAEAAVALDQAMRLAFGTELMTGFTIWDWVNTNSDQWAPYAALYNVTAPNYNNWAITPAGKIWQDRLGIKDWDGNPSNAWDTELTLPLAADGTIDFTGYYGDYEITVNGQTHALSLVKGMAAYTIGTPPMLAGDLNMDGRVDAADYTVWRDAGRSASDYQTWKAHFGESLPAVAGAIPEPSGWLLAAVGLTWLVGWRRGR